MRAAHNLHYVPSCPGNSGGWKERHERAVRLPSTTEAPIVGLLRAWSNYALEHKRRYDSSIGDDGVLGPEWQKIGEGIRGLLNGNTGRLDCGTLDSIIADTLTAEGLGEDA